MTNFCYFVFMFRNLVGYIIAPIRWQSSSVQTATVAAVSQWSAIEGDRSSGTYGYCIRKAIVILERNDVE